MAEIVIADSALTSRRTAYGCCAGEFQSLAIRAYNRGDIDCYNTNIRKAEYLQYAYEAMLCTPTSTEDAEEKCITHDEACEIIQKADPLCVKCGCSPDAASAPPTTTAPPRATNSFLVRAENVGSVATIVPAPNLTVMPFNYVTEDEWSISFWFRFTTTSIPANNVIITLMNPLVNDTPPDGVGAAMFIRLNDNGGGSFYMSLELTVDGDPTNAAQVVTFPFITADVSEWHHFALTRNGPYGTEANWAWYMDGQPTGTLLLANGTPWAAFAYSAQAPMIGSNSYYSNTPALQSAVAQTFYICEIYICGTARSAGEVLGVFYTNSMNSADSTWNRILWLHPHQPPDAVQAIGGISNDGQLPIYTAYDEIDITTDVPVQIA